MKRYIVVDDDATNNLICRLTINRFEPSAEVKLFQNPEEALNYLSGEENHSHSILFLDINMPTMTGWDFLTEFTTLKDEIKSRYDIFMLSSSFESTNDKIKDFPFLSGFYSKPLKEEYLQEISSRRGEDIP